jgi:acetoin utilization deacetylase AcuC-like enzyme
MNIAYISHPDCLLHSLSINHLEQPARLQVIETELIKTGLNQKLQHIIAPAVTREQLLRVHDASYIENIFQMSPKTGCVWLDLDTFMNPYTLSAALHAAGATVYAVDLIFSEKISAAFCGIRPPGHHAERARAMGFCIFNNIAVAAAHALEQYQLKRVAIVDFDVHHGNGTQNIFLQDDRVLFCSSFQHPFYPLTDIENPPNHIINIPLPAGTTSRTFRAEVEQHWLDALEKFKPEMVFFSAGFDGHRDDSIANQELTELDYAWVTRRVLNATKHSCQGRVVSALEGGYALNVLGKCVVAHINALMMD